MGTWSTSINGNDLAQDMRAEYSVAFSRHTPEEAVALLDAYIKKDMRGFDENDGDWVDYRYSLADFMWKKGVLYDILRDEVIRMIDRGAGLDLYDDEKILRKREKVLADFRAKLLSPQPPHKPIRISGIQTKPLFEAGDVIAMQLDTSIAAFEGNPYRSRFPFTEEAFRALHGMWFVLRKVGDHISWRSSVDPTVCDVWPCFQMYKCVSPVCPTVDMLKDIPFARTSDQKRYAKPLSDTVFVSSHTQTGYRRRSMQLIGKDLQGLEEASALCEQSSQFCGGSLDIVFIDIVHPITNSDLDLVTMLVQK